MVHLTRVHLSLISILILIFYLTLSLQLDNTSNWITVTSERLDQSIHNHHTLSVNEQATLTQDEPVVEKVDVFPIFGPTDDPFDSTGEVYYIQGSRGETDDYLAYPVCSFTHVCLTDNSVLFRWSNHSLYQANVQLISNCVTKQYAKRFAYDLCYCFYPKELQPGTVDFDIIQSEQDQTIKLTWSVNEQRPGRPLRTDQPVGSSGSLSNMAYDAKYFASSGAVYTDEIIGTQPVNAATTSIPGQPELIPSSVQPPIYAGHYWSIHKYVAVQHHIGHWAQRLLIFASAMQHFLSLPLPPLTGIIIQDTEGPMSDHERSILETSLWSILTHAPHPIQHLLVGTPWSNQFITMEDLRRGQNITLKNQSTFTHPVCVERMSWIKAFGIFATNTHDTMAYRAVAYQRYGLTGLAHRCPPRQITILTRHNRKILNMQEIIDYFQTEHHKIARVVEIDSSTSAEDQIRVFAESGLLIGSHSSQLVNVMFSHPRSSMIEVSPEYYNSDFSEYAHAMGVFFRYALGGTVPGQSIPNSMTECIDMLAQCEGDSHCILVKRFEPVCRSRQTCCKYVPGFFADMRAVKIAITHAVNHLNWACGENW